jgi:hypothetical protein
MNFIKYFTKSKTIEVTSDELLLEYWEINIVGEARRPVSSLREITEVYVPELKLAINQEGNPINVFILDYDRYNANTNNSKLVKSVKIKKDSETGKKLMWLADIYKNKKEKEKSLVELFVE